MTEYFDGWLTNLSKYIADLNTELVKTKAENAELLRELDLTKRMYAKVSEEKCVTDAENVKLRELAAEMYEAVKCCCDECWFGYGHNPAKCKNENCGYRKEYVAMRELGIEADS